MIKQLRYKVTFRTTGKTLEGNIAFQEGMTAITGKNGNGKSMVLEMIQFALHGNKALRGKADDYEVLESELDFEVKGKTLRIARSKTKATLKELIDGAATDLASGTKAVNLKIVELFGYSADVFQVANACNQGKIEELGNMLPTERKRLVDETIGLNVLDDVTAFIDDKRKSLSSGIKAIESILVAPVKPESSLMYGHDSGFYKAERDGAAKLRDQRNRLQVVAERNLTEPTKVELLVDDDKFDLYREEKEKRAALLAEYSTLSAEHKAIPQAPKEVVTKLEEDDEKQEQYVIDLKALAKLDVEIGATEKELKKYPFELPIVTEAEVEAMRDMNSLMDHWSAKQKLKLKAVPHDCPKCHHHWEEEDPRLATEYKDVPDECPGEFTDLVIIINHNKNRSNYENAQEISKRLEELRTKAAVYDGDFLEAAIKRIGTTRGKFHESQVAVANEERREDLSIRLKAKAVEFAAIPDYTVRIDEIRMRRAEHAQYTVRLENYLAQKKDRDQALEELKVYDPELDNMLKEYEQAYILVLNYETNMKNYETSKQAYDKAVEQLEALRTELADWENGRKAVTDLRAKVKGYLLPSLNTVASILISQMTGGELNKISVTEDFEITVDSQRLETLSGAGKAVANLALRLGLGQVLTNRVFSVFMGDELDASCDDERAQYIAQALHNLTKSITQVIQVSHKQGLVADHHVRL